MTCSNCTDGICTNRCIQPALDKSPRAAYIANVRFYLTLSIRDLIKWRKRVRTSQYVINEVVKEATRTVGNNYYFLSAGEKLALMLEQRAIEIALCSNQSIKRNDSVGTAKIECMANNNKVVCSALIHPKLDAPSVEWLINELIGDRTDVETVFINR